MDGLNLYINTDLPPGGQYYAFELALIASHSDN